MKALLSLLLICLTASVFAVPRFKPHKPPAVTRLSWKQITAGGAAGGTLVAAYKISDGVEDGMKTVAREKPEAFAGTLSTLLFPIHILLIAGTIFGGYKLYCWYRNNHTNPNERIETK